MSENQSQFTWRPLYAELVKKLPSYSSKELLDMANLIGIDVGLRDQFPKNEWVELEDIDPFSFLSLLNKYGDERRIKLLNDLLSLLDSDNSPATDVYGLPTANAQSAWWFGYKFRRKPDDIPNLKLLFEQAVNDSIKEEQFSKALNTYALANAKLTEGLFCVNPEKFLPINSQTIPYLKDRGISSVFNTYDEYLAILQKLKSVIDKPFYKISHEAYLENQKRKSNEAASIEKSKCNYWVFQGNPSQFRIVDALKADAIKTWRVSAHKDKISIGDKVILWVTGDQSGCYALAEVTSDIFTSTDDETEQYYQIQESVKTPSERVRIKILKNLWDNPVRKKQIEDLPEFRNFKGGNQGTTFSSTVEEYEMIEQMLGNITAFEPVSSYNPQKNFPKNTIVYGPPGTGKTYSTIGKAVEIIDGEKSPEHTINKKRFDELLGSQIEFITFHQNYTYEDFVLGIKPDLKGSEGGLRFSRHEGIFYKISQRARKNYEASGWSTSVEQLLPFKEVFEKFIQPLEEQGQEIQVSMRSSKYFHLTGLGENVIDFRKSSGGTAHALSIATLQRIYEGGESPLGLTSYYKPLADLLIKKGTVRQNQKEFPKNYVLVIDEINRANMSRVFGELITLLEEDKRLGAENELQLLLPSGERFAVPPNLYIIGTMNTADKSLALLDIALRRRFEFEGMYPQYDIEGMDPETGGILERLNKAIHDIKKSADFLIGHAYFLNRKKGQLAPVFEKRVIPLLMEYFSGRTELVKQVLDAAHINTKQCDFSYQLKVDDDTL
ncbi:AAA family ATPase [Telluribacter sp.]|jgi:hypothetical protein|uniref:AAA family ATPase n=1 Tax=Telluribacter sp. TaxID=1978767 RepID=UPI002E12FBA9|nr:AAA family ATPase [Telluribacter sp.]